MDDLEIEENDDDYYAFLNLPRDATSEQIQKQYKNLSRVYHPDKHTDPTKKKDAEMIFNRIKVAHAVLSDPEQRSIYDLLGTKGLKTDGWELIHRKASPNEIREEYERLLREKEERKLQQLTNPKGNITLNINCTDIFNSYDNEYDEPSSIFQSIEIAGMSMFQSIEVPLTNNNAATLSGNLNVSNGQGSGRFMLSARRVLSTKGWIELDMGAGNGVILGGKGLRNLGKRIFVNGQVNLNLRQNAMVPSLVGSLAIQLDKHTVGYLTYSAAGLSSSLATVIERNNEKNYVNLTFSLGLPHSFIACNYIRRLTEHEMKLKLSGRVGTFGYLTEYGVEKKVSKYSSVHASVQLGVPSGVVLKIRFMRSMQSYNFHIQLSEEIIPAAVFYATTIPIVSYFFIKKCILEPMEVERHKKVVEKTKEMNEQRNEQKRKEAESAVSLMQAQYERICAEEDAKGGLLILHAYYGKFDEDEGEIDQISPGYNSSFIDVKIPLQCLVKESEIVIHTKVKYELPGFFDPAIGEEKMLKIQYKFGNNVDEITIEDKDELRLPAIKTNNN